MLIFKKEEKQAINLCNICKIILLYPTRENEQAIFCFWFAGQFYDGDKESRKSSGIQETLSKQPTGKMRS
jgi:hypothetical protein